MFDIRKIQEEVLFNAVESESNTETAEAIVNHPEETNPNWVKQTMSRLEYAFDPAMVKKIRAKCQCGYGIDEKLALVREIMAETTTLEEFGKHEKALAAGMSYREGDLYLMFPFCPCPMLAEVERLETKTWCECTVGYSKVLFEKAFECPVDVKLLQSIKAGDPICLMKIIPLGTVQFKF